MIKHIFLIIYAWLVVGCNGGQSTKLGDVVAPEPQTCTMAMKKDYVYAVMHDSYLWADKTPTLSEENLTSIKSDEELLTILKQPKDRFSFIMEKKAHDDYFDGGTSKGFGYFPSLIKDDNGSLLINVDFVYPNSPAALVGLKRGDRIATFDGKKFKDLNQTYYFYGDDNLTTTIKLTDGREFSLTRQEFAMKTVLLKEVKTINGKKIGHLVFQSFIGTSNKELDEAFEFFKNSAVDELVLDLRYNGGGYVYVANHLSSLIGGDRVSGTIFNQYKYNNKYSKYNSIERFEKTDVNSLNLPRVFVITTHSSCSASEIVINSLKSSTNSVEVIQIGKPTCGKPYAMNSMEYCNKYLLPVQMESVNGENSGGYVDGLTPQCSGADDITRDFNDILEDSFASALYYIENGSCRSKFQRSLTVPKRETFIDGFRGIYGIF